MAVKDGLEARNVSLGQLARPCLHHGTHNAVLKLTVITTFINNFSILPITKGLPLYQSTHCGQMNLAAHNY